ncbi:MULTISPECIES: hypothetical protein [Streptomyces]|uniref:Uncharacterized protein n=1 Tax=Streptomyces luteosporeus TaxID=173856 RepID=A0ABN3U7T1_9ACTN
MTATTTETAPGLSSVKPLPAWFFAFEGSMGAAYDLCTAWENAWMVLVAMGLVNLVVGLTVLRGRAKLVKAMLKNSRTRWITAGLIALRVGLHGVLGLAGAGITSTAGHLTLAVVMGRRGRRCCGSTSASPSAPWACRRHEADQVAHENPPELHPSRGLPAT